MSLTYEPANRKPPEPGQIDSDPPSEQSHIPGTPVGAIVSVGLVVICWFALPLSRPFILTLAVSASVSAYFSIGSTAARANEPRSHQSSRNQARHLRLASVHILASATGHAANHPRPLAGNARRASPRLRPPPRRIA